MPNAPESADTPSSGTGWITPSPRVAALIDALADCWHPRAARLRARLTDNPDVHQLALLRGEVLNLLALSFGPAEAQRRMQAAWSIQVQ